MKNLNIELNSYRKLFENELHTNILGFWIKFGIEKSGDGFYGATDLQGKPVLDAPKSCVLNARILWTFAKAAKEYKNTRYAEVAERAFSVLQNHFEDKEFGGYFMSIAANNQPLDTVKHTYAQAFVLYALSKYYEFNPSEKLRLKLNSYFLFLEEKTKDVTNPGYFEAFTRKWELYSENRMADNNEPRSMNTHLHILEAYAAYYKVSKDELAGIRLKELLNLFIEKIIRPTGHLGIFFDEQFAETETSKAICSFGHDIEASWLLWEAAEILGDENCINQMKPLSIKMLDAVDRAGVDKDGGLFLESTRFGSHVRTNKHWWPQAETLVAFMNGLQLSSNPEYWEKLKLSWNFIDKYVIDHKNGEWFTKVNRLGVPYLTEPENDPSPYYRNDWKIDPWKCPYHNGRAMMELIQRIDKLTS
ncbi:AGE family epimerase/isomerase [Prolixibacteraceae bacterium Z1-6]|uniref:Cellobiose 2-epimerase n=1 Tax=Draconibacterium aestuarii TaxID=2998507 RepID=A0A9X3F886_9BACT|nr:AGE family epimerase/isomerase [Prolixibacteraceae bacterium Z1-6]